MADDDPRPDDDATRIYRPYGSPPPASDEPDPFASDGDPFASDPPTAGASGEGEAPPDPFAPSRKSAPPADDPFASEPPRAPASDDPFAPSPSSRSAPADDPFAPEPPKATPPPSGRDRGATDIFGPPIGDPFAPATDSDGASSDDPFAAPPSAADPFSAPPSRHTEAPDPFRAPDRGDDPFAPRPTGGAAPDPFAPSPPSTPDPFAASPPPEAKAPPAPPATPPADPFDVEPADPFAPAPKVPARQPREREDPFAATPSTDSDDPFHALKGPSGGGGGGGFDSSLRDRPFASSESMDLPEAFGTERTLAGAFTPVFSLILQIRAAQRLGDGTALRQRIEALLSEAARTARSYNVPEGDVEEATFCLVAFLDEAILATDWPGRDRWSAEPLQLAHYDRYDAGERFFDRLKRLLDEGAARTGVLEVYYLCLALGFKGRYAIQGREVLRRLVEDLHSRLERANGAAGALSPRGRSREVPAEAEKGGIPTWALWVGAAVLVALLYLGLSFSLSGAANETATDLRALTDAPAAPAE